MNKIPEKAHENLAQIVEMRAKMESAKTPELWCENWFFGVSSKVLDHIGYRPVSDAYVGGMVSTLEDFEMNSGYTYSVYWLPSGTCVHVLYDSHGAVWAVYCVDLVWS